MKKILVSTIFGLLVLPNMALAESKSGITNDDVVIPSAPSVSVVSSLDEKGDSINERTLRRMSSSTMVFMLKSRGNTLINERLSSIESNKALIASNAKLTQGQKDIIIGQLSKSTALLNGIKTSLASSTDASSTKALVNSIYTSARVYGIVIPQARLEKRFYDLENHTKTLSETFLKVQIKIDEAKAQGKDVTVWQKSLDDAKMLVANDMNSIATALPKVIALTPQDYGTTSKAVIESANATLKTIVKDFASIKKSVHKPSLMNNATSSRKVTGNGSGKSSPLFGSSWVWVSGSEATSSVSVPSGEKFIVSFGEDNRVMSTTDCNSLNGSYKVEGNKLTFGPMAMTMMFCDGSQESVYVRMLSSVTSYTVVGTELKFTLNNGGVMLFKKK